MEHELLPISFGQDLKDNGYENETHTLVKFYSGNDDVALIRDDHDRGVVIFDCHSAHGMWDPQRFDDFSAAVVEFHMIVEDLQEQDLDHDREPGEVTTYEE